MASSVAGPLERAFATIPGITMMTSSSSLGVTNIVMQFDLDRNIDGAALDVQSNISATLRKLPPQLPAPPSFQKLNPGRQPGSVHRAGLQDPAAVQGRRLRRTGLRPADLADRRRRAGVGVRPAEIRRARRRRPRRRRRARLDARRGQQRRRGRQFLDAGRRAARAAAELHRRRHRPDGARRRIQRSGRGLAQRRARAPQRNRQGL